MQKNSALAVLSLSLSHRKVGSKIELEASEKKPYGKWKPNHSRGSLNSLNLMRKRYHK